VAAFESADGHSCNVFSILFIRFCGFQARLSRGCTPFVEDQTVEVVGEVGQREFGLRAGNADGADEQAIAVLLMREDMLDAGPDR
jgi:hypothetical protein